MRHSIKLAIAAVTVVGAASIGYGLADASTPSGGYNGPHGRVGGQPHVAPAVVIAPTNAGSVFTPLSPCRIADTRRGGGIVKHGRTRQFVVTGGTGFAAQGGRSTGCAIPATATAVSLSITAIGETAAGYITLYPVGASRPVARALSYIKSVSITGSSTATLGTTRKLAAYNGSTRANTHLTLDVNGYYSPQIQARITPVGVVYSGTSPVLSATHRGTGNYQITVNRDLTGCNAVGSASGGGYIVAAYTSGSSVYADTYSLSGTAEDIYWSFTVEC